jgi:sugar phosphate permease
VDQRRTRIFYGWYVVVACFVVNFIVFGISVNTFTVFVKPIEQDLGWSRKAVSMGLSLAIVTMGIAAPFMGRVIDRMGARLVMAAGAGVMGVVFFILSRTQSLLSFYSCYAIGGLCQAAATTIPISLVISNWFNVKRGTALGLAMTGTGLGGMLMVPVMTWIVVNWGWRTSYFVGGCIILVVVPLNLLLIRTRPSEKGLLPDGATVLEGESAEDTGLTVQEALKTRSFWLIGCMMLLFGTAWSGIGVHLMAYLTDIGHSERVASLAIGIMLGLTIAGKVGMGWIVDSWGIRGAVGVTFAMVSLGMILLMKADTAAMAYASVIVYGFAVGAPLLINPAITAQCMGLRQFGTLFGILMFLQTPGLAAGPILAGAIYDARGSYLWAFVLSIVLVLAAGLCGLMTRNETVVEPTGIEAG